MQFTVIDQENLDKIFSAMEDMRNELTILNKKIAEDGNSESKIYTNKGIKALLGIGDKTLQRYRDEGKLRFHQDKDKFWYTQADVDEFLVHTEVEPYAYTD